MKNKEPRTIEQMTESEAKSVLLLEMRFDGDPRPKRIKSARRNKHGWEMVVAHERYADERRGFSFAGRKSFATYQYLLARGIVPEHRSEVGRLLDTLLGKVIMPIGFNGRPVSPPIRFGSTKEAMDYIRNHSKKKK